MSETETPHDQTRDAVRQMLTDVGRIVSPDGIDEARYVTLGGARQWITIRGQDRTAPILLFLHGGPGGAISDIGGFFQRPWEDYFTVVHWDQRGFGRSSVDGAKLEGTITVEQLVSDGIELIEMLSRELGQEKAFVLGQSWGTVLALEIAHRRPDLLHAAASMGQNTHSNGNFEETQRLLLEHAQEHQEADLLEQLQNLGPLPDRTSDEPGWIKWVGFVQTEMVRRGFSWYNFRGPGTDWNDRILAMHLVSPSAAKPPAAPDPPFTNGPATPHLEIGASFDGWSLRGSVGTRFECPILMISGAHDWQTPKTLTRAYYDEIDAPWKIYVEFPHSAHVVTMEEPGRMIVTLVQCLLPAAHGAIPLNAERREIGA